MQDEEVMTFEIINVKQFVNAGSLVNDGQPGLYMNAVYIHTYIYIFFHSFCRHYSTLKTS